MQQPTAFTHYHLSRGRLMVKWLKHLACSVRNERKLLELIQIFLQIVIYKLILQIMHFRVVFFLH